MSLRTSSRTKTRQRSLGEKGYPWLSWPKTPSALLSIGILIAVIFTVSVFVGWYVSANIDTAPDSPLGYSFAILGVGCFLAAFLLYWRERRSHRRIIGQLHAALNWHILFGVLGLFFVMLHSFGNFNPRSGTYALYGMIALVVSGIIGQVLDRILPRLGTREVHTALTTQGEDRIDQITQRLTALPYQPNASSLSAPRLEPTQILQESEQYAHIQSLQHVQRALQREQVYRHIIRYWRVFHRLLAVVTLGLTIWHIVYAVRLLLPH